MKALAKMCRLIQVFAIPLLISTINFVLPHLLNTVESRKFEVLATRDFISKYRKVELLREVDIIQLLTYVEVDIECY